MEPTPSDQELLAEAKRLAIGVARNLATRLDRATDEQAPALVMAFERDNLVLRRSILLSDGRTADPEARREAIRTDGRKRVLRQVADAIEAKNFSAEKTAALRVELIERVESPELRPDLDADILAGRTAEVVENLKRDLGVSTRLLRANAPRRTPGDVAALIAIARGRPDPAPPLAPGALRRNASSALRHNIPLQERRSSPP